MGKSFFTSSETLLYTGSENFITRLVAGGLGAFGITAAQIATYQTANDLFAVKYLACSAVDTRTRALVSEKNAARTSLRALASDYAKIIDATPTVSDAQKLELGLSVRKLPTPILPPDTAPDLEVVSVRGRSVTVKLRDSVTGRRGRPVGAAGAAVFSCVSPTVPTTTEQWQWNGNTGKTTELIEFPEETAAGATVWFTAVWFNRRTETGPNATPISTNLPGGAAEAA